MASRTIRRIQAGPAGARVGPVVSGPACANTSGDPEGERAHLCRRPDDRGDIEVDEPVERRRRNCRSRPLAEERAIETRAFVQAHHYRRVGERRVAVTSAARDRREGAAAGRRGERMTSGRAASSRAPRAIRLILENGTRVRRRQQAGDRRAARQRDPHRGSCADPLAWSDPSSSSLRELRDRHPELSSGASAQHERAVDRVADLTGY